MSRPNYVASGLQQIIALLLVENLFTYVEIKSHPSDPSEIQDIIWLDGYEVMED